jgi:zinc ribbon protein
MQEPFKFCSACGAQNNLSAQFCQRCGARYDGAPPPVAPAQPKQKSQLSTLFMLIVAGFGCCIVSGIISKLSPDKSTPPASTSLERSPAVISSPRPTPTPLPVLPPAEHLAEAKKLLSRPEISGYYGAGRSVYEEAVQHLNAIPPEAKEYKEAQRMFGAASKKHEREQAAAAATVKRAEAAAESAARKAGADNVERGLLSKGYDATVTVSGPQNSTIKITYVLMSRPTVYQLVEAGFLNQLRAQGFRKVIFSDGYGNTWWYTL